VLWPDPGSHLGHTLHGVVERGGCAGLGAQGVLFCSNLVPPRGVLCDVGCVP